ncbi:MAG: hypothetical protein A2Y10_18125 [Planctomycetes bacterium GWF2_41_51]|nr:MAG: hypothetical protein A2Y10_18125 [Planctomycetes bacterium GWF2_41_51]
MANSGAIKAGAAYVQIFADKSPLMRGLRAAQVSLRAWGNTISSFGRKMIAVGSAAIAPLVGAAKYFSTYGDNIAKMSRRTGIAVESLSALGFAAEQEGSSLETVEKGIRRMQQSILDANMGLKTATDIYGQLGLSAKSFEGLNPEEQFRLLADSLSQIEDPSKRAAIAMRIFGRSGTALLPLFERGAAGMDELMKEAKELGLVLSSEDAASAEELNDALNRMWRTIKMSYANLGAAIAPIITDLSNKIALVIAKTSNWIKENRSVIHMTLWLGAALVSAGGAFVVFGNALKFAGSIFGTISSCFALIKTALLWILSPLGMVITAVTAATAAFLYFTGYGGGLMQWLGRCFNSLKEDVILAFDGISKALAKGDLGLAARIAWLLVKLEWLKAKQWLLEIWYSVKLKVLEYWYSAIHGIVDSFNIAVYGIQSSRIDTVALLKTAWAGFKQYYGSIVDWLAKKMLRIWIWWKKLIDPTFDADFAKQSIDDQFESDRKERQEQTNKDMQEIEKDRTEKRSEVEKQLNAQLLASRQLLDEDMQKQNDEAEAKSKQIVDELAKTKREFDDSIARANEPVQPKQMAKLPSNKWQLGSSALDKVSTTGTFSAFGLSQLGAGGVMQKIADATMRTAEATEDIADNTSGGGAEFGD